MIACLRNGDIRYYVKNFTYAQPLNGFFIWLVIRLQVRLLGPVGGFLIKKRFVQHKLN